MRFPLHVTGPHGPKVPWSSVSSDPIVTCIPPELLDNNPYLRRGLQGLTGLEQLGHAFFW